MDKIVKVDQLDEDISGDFLGELNWHYDVLVLEVLDHLEEVRAHHLEDAAVVLPMHPVDGEGVV